VELEKKTISKGLKIFRRQIQEKRNEKLAPWSDRGPGQGQKKIKREDNRKECSCSGLFLRDSTEGKKKRMMTGEIQKA